MNPKLKELAEAATAGAAKAPTDKRQSNGAPAAAEPSAAVQPPRGIPGQRKSALFYLDNKPLPFASHGDGIYIYTEDGRRFIDGCSGAFAAAIGHGNKRVAKVAFEQASKIAFAYRTQFETHVANELADLLVMLGPPELNRVFFVNSGSEAVEACIKLARQYWWTVGKAGKNLVIARRPSYHGATLGALSATAYAPLNIPFRGMTLPFPKISAPYCYHCPLHKEYPSCEMACARELERSIHVHGADNIAAFITEPIGGASTGGAVPPPEWFPMVERICRENNILFIVDEVLTGSGRTGTFYGFSHWDVTPDIVAVSKGMGGGYTPIGACIAQSKIVEPVLAAGGFMHGHTFAGNPLSAAISLEATRIIIEDGLVENAAKMGTLLHERLRELMGRYPIVGDVRGRGLLAGVEFVRDRAKREPFPPQWDVAREAARIAHDLGLLIYPRRSLYGLSGDHVSIAPPLIISPAQVEELVGLFEETLKRLTAMLQRHLAMAAEQEAVGVSEARYQQDSARPAYTRGDLHDVPTPDGANVTSRMRMGENEPFGTELVDESDIL